MKVTTFASVAPESARQALLDFWCNYYKDVENVRELMEREHRQNLPHYPQSTTSQALAADFRDLDLGQREEFLTANVLAIRVENFKWYVLQELENAVPDDGTAEKAVIIDVNELRPRISQALTDHFPQEELVTRLLDGDFSIPGLNSLSLSALAGWVRKELLPWLGRMSALDLPVAKYYFLRYNEGSVELHTLYEK